MDHSIKSTFYRRNDTRHSILQDPRKNTVPPEKCDYEAEVLFIDLLVTGHARQSDDEVDDIQTNACRDLATRDVS